MTISNPILHDSLYKGFPVEGLLYFTFGMLLRRKEQVPVISCSIGWVLFFGGLGMFVARSYVQVPEVQEFLRCCGIPFALFGLWAILPVREEFQRVRSLSFPIYILHPIVLTVLTGVLDLCGLREVVFKSISGWIMLGGVTILTSAGLAVIINRIPFVGRLAFGMRGV